MEGLSIGLVILLIIVGIIVLWGFFYIIPFGLWLSAVFARVYVSIGQLIGMRFRKVPPGIVVNALVSATKAGLKLSINDLEAHYLAGGNVRSL
jgi:uncharacterized protein YqfA (UPF0365 family)